MILHPTAHSFYYRQDQKFHRFGHIKVRPDAVCRSIPQPDQHHCIYGLFDSGGCFYVGETECPFQRHGQHRQDRKWRLFRFVILRWCRDDQAHLLEARIARAYKRKGRKLENKHMKPVNGGKYTWKMAKRGERACY